MITEDYWGSNVVWFTGVVEDRHDPLEANRVRVRIHGIHPDSQSVLSTGDLPWASIGMPVTTGGSSGVGSTPHRLVEGAWVVGIFLDGMVAQQPLVMATILGVNEVSANDPCGLTNSTGSMAPGDTAISHGSVPPINVPGNNHREKAFNYFLTKGYTPEQSAGIVGNLMVESTVNIKPGIVNGIGATGIAQWLGARKSGLYAWSQQNGYDWNVLETQLLYISKELNSSETRANRMVKQASTPEDAALAFCAFERDESYDMKTGQCNPNSKTTRTRMGYARDTYDKYANGRTATPQTTITEDRADRASVADATPAATLPSGSTEVAGASTSPTTSRCSPSNIIESNQKLQGQIDSSAPSAIQIISTNVGRDQKSDTSSMNASVLIERDGTVRQLGDVSGNVVVMVEGGNASYVNAKGVSSDFTGYYTQPQLRSLTKLIKYAREANPSVTINGEQAKGLPRTIFEG